MPDPDPVAPMERLAVERPLFHSEADFQLAFAWLIKDELPAARVRLEYRPAYVDRRGYLDIWLQHGGVGVAIELTYFTRALEVTVEDEGFALLNQGAQDVSRYDFVRDVERVESVVHHGVASSGFAIALTNDSSYWRAPAAPRATADSAFRVHEGRLLEGTLGWSVSTGPGTMRGREQPHALRNAYPIEWRDYSRFGDRPGQTFRYALVRVRPR